MIGAEWVHTFTPIGYVGSHASRLPYRWHFTEALRPSVAGDPCNYLRDRSQALKYYW